MALKLSTELPTGIVAADAYYKIERLVSTKEQMNIFVEVYYNQQARQDGKQPISSEFYQALDEADINKYVKGIEQSNGDVIARGYLYLKEKIDKFSSALDV